MWYFLFGINKFLPCFCKVLNLFIIGRIRQKDSFLQFSAIVEGKCFFMFFSDFSSIYEPRNKSRCPFFVNIWWVTCFILKMSKVGFYQTFFITLEALANGHNLFFFFFLDNWQQPKFYSKFYLKFDHDFDHYLRLHVWN